MASYGNMEEVLKLINKKYVSLDTNQVKHNNERLKSVLSSLIEIMKHKDTLFKKLYERPYYGGSYYDDLKVGKPDEFDLDLLLVLPKVCDTHNKKGCGCVTLTPSNRPGFFWFKIQKGYCIEMDKFIKDGYMQTDLVLNWLKGIITVALNNYDDCNIYGFSVKYDPPTYFSESGPALTLKLFGNFGHMDVDLVPAFKFGPDFWPKEGFRSNTTLKQDFFIVPKKTKGMNFNERFWRPSFQDQERELIKGRERLKPALRLLKKMRNNLVQSSISSYSLKTIVLLELDTGYFNWNDTLSDTFMRLLEKYKDSLYSKKIAYYWNKNNNLLDCVNPLTLENHHNEIAAHLKRIKDKYSTDPCIVAKIILKEGTKEYKDFMTEYNQTFNPIGLMENTSSSGSSYYTFDPRDSDTPSIRNPGSDNQQTVASSSTNWGGIIAGIGALAVGGIAVLAALNRNNNNQNR